jgi:molybdenum cofactor cytidylyltransferase
MRPTVHILVLAAGASSRMRGSDKLLQPIKGKPILRGVAEIAVATGCPVVVTLPGGATTREEALAGCSVQIVRILDAAQGMSRSIVHGLDAILTSNPGPEDGVMILPADMPGFSTKVLADLIDRFRAEPELIWRGGSVEGKPGHPAIFPRDLWPALAAIRGDEGGRSVLIAQKERVRVVPLPGDMALLDLDTPEDWAAYLGGAPSL